MKTSLTPRTLRRSSYEPTVPYVPFFLRAIIDSQSIESHSLTWNVSRKNTKSVYSIRRTVRRVAIHNPVGEKKRSETGFFNPSFRLHKKWPSTNVDPFETQVY